MFLNLFECMVFCILFLVFRNGAESVSKFQLESFPYFCHSRTFYLLFFLASYVIVDEQSFEFSISVIRGPWVILDIIDSEMTSLDLLGRKNVLFSNVISFSFKLYAVFSHDSFSSTSDFPKGKAL